MQNYIVSLMRASGSTYWSEIAAESAEEAVATYINFPADSHPASRVAQVSGGVVVVGEKPFGTYLSTPINGYGIKIFRVAPGPKPSPEPLERAHIVEQVTS